MKGITIGKIAKLSGTTTVTLRYYERIKLIPKPYRATSGYRYYSADLVDQIHFIQRSKALGFSLEEIRELLSLRDLKHAKSMPVRKKVLAKLDDVKSKIKNLRATQKTLEKLVSSCDGKMPIEQCPIMEHIYLGKK